MSGCNICKTNLSQLDDIVRIGCLRVISSLWITSKTFTLSTSLFFLNFSMVMGLTSRPRASATRWMIASRDSSEWEVSNAESQSPAWTA